MEMWYRGNKDLEGTAEEGGGWKESDCVLISTSSPRAFTYCTGRSQVERSSKQARPLPETADVPTRQGQVSYLSHLKFIQHMK